MIAREKLVDAIALVRESKKFDQRWYCEQYPDVLMTGMDPVMHYLWLGERLNRNPSPSFDVATYRCAHPELASRAQSPLLHSLGYELKRDVKDPAIDRSSATDSELIALVSGSDMFDANWYLSKYASEPKGLDPATHYISVGASLGYDPSERFSTLRYLDRYRDVRAARVNPLVHYITHGFREGRSPLPEARSSRLSLLRITPEEGGIPDSVLKYDEELSNFSLCEGERLAVHVHLYHPEMASQIVDYLRNIRHPFVLLVSVGEHESPEMWRDRFSSELVNATEVNVERFPNRGRDVAPWVVGFRDSVLKSTIFCHLHTKRSTHNTAHAGWFRFLAHSILGSEGVVDGVLSTISSDNRVGIVSPCYHWSLANQPNYGKNRDLVSELCSRIWGAQEPEECPDYPAGSFFWARTRTLEPLLNLGLSFEDFPREAGQVEGTLAHAIERLIGILPLMTNTRLHMVAVDVAYNLTRYMHDGRKHLAKPARHAARPRKRALTEKVAVYTANTGGYESTMPLFSDENNLDMNLFTDDPSLVGPPGFRLRVCNYVNPVPVRTARFVKTHPHVWFPDYDFAVWCDSNVHFSGDLTEYLDILVQSGADCGFIVHPVRDGVLEEVQELLRTGIVSDSALLREQIARYSSLESVVNARLIETNFFICRPGSPKVALFMNTWWGEINRYSHRDQLSVNYAIESSGVSWVPLLKDRTSARDHSDFMLFSHNVKNRNEFLRTGGAVS